MKINKINDINKTGILTNILIFFIIFEASLILYLHLQVEDSNNLKLNILYIHKVVLYTVIVFSIVFYDKYGKDFHLDNISLWMLTMSCFIHIKYKTQNEMVYQTWLSFLGIILIFFIVKNRKKIKKTNLSTFLMGFLWGVGLAVIVTIVAISLPENNPIKAYRHNFATPLFTTIFLNLSFVTILEEVIYRGILVGLLTIKGYKENTAFIIQGVLFWAVHYQKNPSTTIFFFAIPIITLILTLIVRKHKTLSLSITAHTLVNTLPYYFVNF